jgi:hypothetical protein
MPDFTLRHKLTLEWNGEFGDDSAVTGFCICGGWWDIGYSKREMRDEYRVHLEREKVSASSAADVAKAIVRQIAALGQRLAEEDAELRQLRRIEDALDAAWLEAVNGLRAHGMSDAQIGRELGVSRQAVRQRWPHE